MQRTYEDSVPYVTLPRRGGLAQAIGKSKPKSQLPSAEKRTRTAHRGQRLSSVPNNIDSLQAMMARNGSFPLPVAQELLATYARPGDAVFDPFCGKGTALLAARALGCSAYGLDVAPEAVVTAAAKLQNVSLRDVVAYLEDLKTPKRRPEPVPTDIRTFFHPATLTQILNVRDALFIDIAHSDVPTQGCAKVALGLLLGILHGHASYSLSISSAHAYSMAPGYVARFAKEHGLVRPRRNVRKCLIAKAMKTIPAAIDNCTGEVRLGSALTCDDVFPELRGTVDIVLTSPPYLDRQTYAKDNWLRLWLLGYNYKTIKPTYLETGDIARYTSAIHQFFIRCANLLRPGGRLICIAGDVRRRRNGSAHCFETGTLLAEICHNTGLYNLLARDTHEVPSYSRYLHALNRTNGHAKRNLLERVFVVQRTVEM